MRPESKLYRVSQIMTSFLQNLISIPIAKNSKTESQCLLQMEKYKFEVYLYSWENTLTILSTSTGTQQTNYGSNSNQH